MDVHKFTFYFAFTLLILVALATLILSLKRIIYAVKYKKVTNSKVDTAACFELDLAGDHQKPIHTPPPQQD